MTAHQPRLVQSHHVHHRVHGAHRLGRFNAWLALKITNAVGTMWAAYLFLAIALVSFPEALAAIMRGDVLTGVMWLSNSMLQLVLLPVIIVGQRVLSEAQDKRAEADHETLTVLHRINRQQLDILEILRDESGKTL